MAATQSIRIRKFIAPEAMVEIVVWEVEPPVRASLHSYKYRLAYVVRGECVLRYDNEAGKGDHKHIGDKEVGISFESLEGLLSDFWGDVNNMKR